MHLTLLGLQSCKCGTDTGVMISP